ncbi:MAG: ATP-binding protein, partial [Akkermansiaceae bacterium]|nr:ATP-binding protein [Akkermansiaceae bacterium]MDP4995788.1 ATP-binding protein [Akkermansiaceae bacterium]
REKDFIRHASHELRTPIAALGATTELALSRPREAAEYIRHLESCAKTSAELSTLVNSLTALARIGGNNTPPQLVALSFSEILDETLAKFTKPIAANNITIETTGSAPTALGDPAMTGIILSNLLDNAISYSAPGSTISINLSAHPDHAEISFTNPSTDLPEDLERLFEPLFRRDSARTSNTHLGIGLTLSREAASAMSGTLTATCPGNGLVCFCLCLPAFKP